MEKVVVMEEEEEKWEEWEEWELEKVGRNYCKNLRRGRDLQ